MRSIGVLIPLSFASLPVISITFFDKKKQPRRQDREDEVDVPLDGLSLEDLERTDLESDRSDLEDDPARDSGVLLAFPGWYFIPSITISLPGKVKGAEPHFDPVEDEEIIEGIRKAPLPDTLFSPPKEYERPAKDRDVAEFDPETDAIIRPDADTESIVVPKVLPPPVKERTVKRPELASSAVPADLPDMDLDLDLDEQSAVMFNEINEVMPEDHLIIPDKPGPDKTTVLPVSMDRDDLDLMLGGGLPRSSIVLIEGKKGSGVEHFVQRLTYGFLQNGVGVTYISTENSTNDFIRQMYGSGYMMANHLLGKKILYIPIDSLIRKDRAMAGYIDRLIRSPQLLNDVMIIDRLSTMTENDQDENGHLKLLSYLKGAVAKDRTVILVTDSKQNGIETIREEARARMSMSLANGGEGTVRSVQVLKYPDSVPDAKQEIRFKIEPGLGMVVQ